MAAARDLPCVSSRNWIGHTIVVLMQPVSIETLIDVVARPHVSQCEIVLQQIHRAVVQHGLSLLAVVVVVAVVQHLPGSRSACLWSSSLRAGQACRGVAVSVSRLLGTKNCTSGNLVLECFSPRRLHCSSRSAKKAARRSLQWSADLSGQVMSCSL